MAERGFGDVVVSALNDSDHDFMGEVFWEIDCFLGHGIWVLKLAELLYGVLGVFVFS